MKRSCRSQSWLLLFIFLAGAAEGRADSASDKPLLLVDYVATIQTNHVATTAVKLFPSGPTNLALIPPPRQFSAEDRRQQFDAEFGIPQKDPSLLKSSIESAKYKLDETVFTAKEFADNLHYESNLTDLMGGGSHPSSSPKRYYSDPVLDSVENARIRTGLDWDAQTGRAFLGVRLLVPFGD